MDESTDYGTPDRKVFPPITPPEGLVCPKCGCRHLPVSATRRSKNRIIRYRNCRNCNRRIITYELFREDAEH